MYAATTDRHPVRLNFQVSGMLWDRSLVMRDLETGTLWSHLLGKAMRGPLKGVELKVLPSVITSWKDWQSRHPESSVLALSRTAHQFVRDRFLADADRFVLGLVVDGKSGSVPLTKLQKAGAAPLVVGDQSFLVAMNGKEGAIETWRMDTENGRRRIDALGRGADGTQWNLQTGLALSGPRQGEQLERAPGILSYRGAWEQFHGP